MQRMLVVGRMILALVAVGLAAFLVLGAGLAAAQAPAPTLAMSPKGASHADTQLCAEPPSPALVDLESLQFRVGSGKVEPAGYGCPVGYGLCSGRCYPLGTVCCGNGTACPSLSNCCGTGCCSHGTVCVMVNGGYGCRRQF